MTALLDLLASALVLSQGVPEKDRRNTEIFHTDTVYEARSYASLEEWEARRAVLRHQILFAAGLEPMPERVTLDAEVFGRIEHEHLTVEKVLIRTLPGYYLAGNLYRPRGGVDAEADGPYPGVLQPHGHWAYGRLERTERASPPTLSANLARQGYVVFAYDMVGYNDTLQTPHRFGGREEELWGFSPLGLQLWNSIRALDFLQSLSFVDGERIAMTGASGGGTQTFLLYAVDERVRWAAPVNMVSSIMQGGDLCENSPTLRIGTFNVEIAALMAPRPLLLVSATGDWTRNTPQVEYPMIRSVYSLYGKENLVENVHVDAPHNYNLESREAVYRFLGRHVLGRSDAEDLGEKAVPTTGLSDLMVLHRSQLPADAVSYEQLFENWRDSSRKQARDTDDVAVLWQRLRLAIGATWPREVAHRIDGEKILLHRPGRGDRVPGFWFPGKEVPVLVVHPEGAATALESEAASRARDQRRPVLTVDVFQTGAAQEARGELPRFYSTFNLVDDARRIQDILTAAAFLNQQTGEAPELYGEGGSPAQLWTLFAAALEPERVRLLNPSESIKGGWETFFVPGVHRAGGMAAALRVLAARGESQDARIAGAAPFVVWIQRKKTSTSSLTSKKTPCS